MSLQSRELSRDAVSVSGTELCASRTLGMFTDSLLDSALLVDAPNFSLTDEFTDDLSVSGGSTDKSGDKLVECSREARTRSFSREFEL